MQDFRAVRRLLRKHTFRKAVPAWSVPAEIWRMLLLVATRLLQGFCAIRKYQLVPGTSQLSQTHKLSKCNGKEGCLALRTVNCLDSIGKCFFKHIWSKAVHSYHRPYASGYARGRSRLEAIIHQHVVAERLHAAGLSFVSCFHDIANAFPSMSHSHLYGIITEAARPCDAPLLLARVRSTGMVVDACDASVVVAPQSGTLQGDSIAGDLFLAGYHPLVDAWTADLSSRDPSYRIPAYSPLDLAEVDLALSTYADDLCRKILVRNPADASSKVQYSNRCLDAHLAPAGMAQNTGKQEHVVRFAGQGARVFTRTILQQQPLDGSAVPRARYLGGFQTHIACPSYELTFRIARAYAAWCTFRRLWYSCELPWKGLRTIFLGMVYEVLFSGLEALLLTKVHTARLDRVVAGYGRKLMRGKACGKAVTESGETKYTQIAIGEVFRYLGVASAAVELRIRRLKFLQFLSRDPFQHVHILTALFGVMAFDPGPTLDFAHGVVSDANRYAKLFWDDLQSLEMLDSAYWLLEVADGNLLAFFTELAPDFQQVDVSELRARELCVQIPPPGTLPQVAASVDDGDIEVPLHVCQIRLEDGSQCGKQFGSLCALLLHQRRSKSGNHSTVSDFYKAAHVNQCPWCLMVHASIISTRRHIRRRLETGVCPADSRCAVWFSPHPTHLLTWFVKFCGVEATNLPQLFAHIRSHFP